MAMGAIESGQRVTRVRAQGSFVHVFSDLREDTEPASSYDADVLHFYVVLFASVFLVFPGLGLTRRLILLGAGLAALFLFHVAVILVNVEHMYAVELAQVSARNYSDRERAVWEWLRDTSDYFAVQLLPAAALLGLVVYHGGFGRKFPATATSAASQSSAPDGPGRSRRLREGPAARARGAPRRVLLAVVLVGAVLAGASVWAGSRHLGKVRARQAEKETMLGYRGLQAGAESEASALFSSALSRQPGLVEARDGLGLSYMLQGRLADAADEFRAVIQQRPNGAIGHLHLGNALYGMSDFKGAATEFQATIRMQPDHKEAWFNLAMSLKKLGRREDSELALHRVLQLDPDYVEALFELSASMIASNRACAAVPHLRRLAKLEPATKRGDLARETVADLEGPCGRDEGPILPKP